MSSEFSTTKDPSEVAYSRAVRTARNLSVEIAAAAAQRMLAEINRAEVRLVQRVPIETIAEHFGAHLRLSLPDAHQWARIGLEGRIQQCSQLQLNIGPPREHYSVEIFAPSLAASARARFTLAHEIAHVAVDSILTEKGLVLSPVETEAACDLAAASTLLPDFLLYDLFAREAPSRLSVDLLLEQCKRAGVSLAVAINRLHDMVRKKTIDVTNGVFLVTVSRSRRKGINAAPRVFARCIPQKWFLPVNKRLSTLGLDALAESFHAKPLFTQFKIRESVAMWEFEFQRKVSVPAWITSICYRLGATPVARGKAYGTRIMLSIFDFG